MIVINNKHLKVFALSFPSVFKQVKSDINNIKDDFSEQKTTQKVNF